MARKAKNVYRISGTVIDHPSQTGIRGLRVEAWDKDLIVDDLVGNAITNQEGKFEVEFTAKYFKELFLDRKPDLFFKVFQGDRLLGSTENNVLWNVAAGEKKVIIELDLDATQPPPPGANGATTAVVQGRISSADGQLLEDALVRAFDKEMRSEEPLGETTANQDGHYEIHYSQQFYRPGKQSADLVVRVVSQDGRELAASPIIFNARPVETVDLTVATKDSTTPSQYEGLITRMAPVLQGVPASELTESDLEFVSGDTKADLEQIGFVTLAARYAAKMDVPAEAFYALFRQGLPTGLGALLLQPVPKLRAALEQSIQDRIIPATLSPRVDEIVATLGQPGNLVQLDEGEKAPVLPVIATTNLSVEDQAQFVSAYVQHDGSTESFWQGLRANKSFTEAQVKELQFTLQLGRLTQQHAPLIAALLKRGPAGELKSLGDLAEMQDDDWLALVSQPGVGIPKSADDGSGDKEAQSKNYVQGIVQLVAAAFPTAVVAAEMKRANRPEDSDALRFFANCPDFELGTTRIDDYLANQSEQAFAGVNDKQALREQLKSMQRVFSVSPNYQHMQTLLDQGLESAYAITDLSQTAFVGHLSSKLGGDQLATAYYAKAKQITDVTASVFGNVVQSVNDVTPRVIGKSPPGIKELPNFTTLFGSQSLCACDECESVYGAAAYLVDLLHMLDPRTGDKPIEELRKRRPDIEHIQLTCENTNTELPYIDLANEIMEYYVANSGDLSQLPAHNTEDASADELSVTPQFTNEQAYDILKTASYPPSLPFDRSLAVARSYLGHLGSSRYEVMQQFTSATDPAAQRALDAEYLGISAEEYQVLTGEDFAGNAIAIADAPRQFYGYENYFYPRLSQKTTDSEVAIRALQALLNVAGAHPAVPVNGTFDDATGNAVNVFKSAHGLQADGIVDTGTWQALMAIHPNIWQFFLAQVPQFLQHTGLGYSDVSELVATHFVNPDPLAPQSDVISAGPNQCDINGMWIQHQDESELSADDLMKMQIFIRLWRKLGWTIADLDRAITAFGASAVTPHLLQNLARTVRVQTALGISVPQALSFWANVDTDGADSLYLQLFQNKGVVNPVDDAFSLFYVARLDSLPSVTWPQPISGKISYSATGKELTYAGAMSSGEKQQLLDLSTNASYEGAIEQLYQTRWRDGIELAIVTASTGDKSISGHSAAILAGLRISDADLAVIRAVTNLAADAAPLNLSNLSALYRYATLAKGLQLRVGDLVDLKILSGLEPFGSPAQTETFVQMAQEMQVSGFSVGQLNYLYRDLSAAPGSLAPDPTRLSTLARTIRDGLLQIVADNTVVDDPSGQVTQAKLSTLFEGDVVTQTLTLISGTAIYNAPLGTLPANIGFADSVKSKVSYNLETQALQFQGAMTSSEEQDLLAASNDAGYQAAVRSLAQQPGDFIKNVLTGFLEANDAIQNLVTLLPSLDANLNPVLLDANGNVTTDQSLATTTVIASKFAYLLVRLLSYLRDQLSASLVKQTMSDALTLDGTMAEWLLENASILPSRTDPSRPAMDDFRELQTTGLSATYFSSNDMSGDPATARVDTSVDFDGSGTTPDQTIPAGAGSIRWEGELLAPSTNSYIFYVRASGNVQLWVGNNDTGLTFTLDPGTSEWSSQPVSLSASQLYDLRLEVTQLNSPALVELRWSCAVTPKDIIPSSNLYPGTVLDNYTAAFTLLDKVALLINGFGLTTTEVEYFTAHAGDFANVSFAALPLERTDPDQIDTQAVALFAWWQRLNDYVTLRNSIPQGQVSLIDVFGASSLEDRLPVLQKGCSGAAVIALQRLLNIVGAQPSLVIGGTFDTQTDTAVTTFQGGQGLSPDGVVGPTTWNALKLAAPQHWQNRMAKAAKEDALGSATGWDVLTIDLLSTENRLNLVAADFTNEIALNELQTCVQLVERLGVSADQCFQWATKPPTVSQAKEIATTVKSKYDDATWLTIGKGLNDGLRENQRKALLAYILADPKIIAEGISNSNQLFEYFLIDVEMSACMMTSRIKQAISSVQLFIQRCLMNLEPGVDPSFLDEDQWAWMKNYRVWEANREVFLYPENWIVPELRDDKSPFFVDLENQLLQNDITSDTAEDAFLDYLQQLDEVAGLQVCGIYSQYEDLPDGISNILHIFGRTKNTPPAYYYRQLINYDQWTPWDQVTADIQSDHLLPVVYDRRLYLFWASFEEKSDESQDLGAPMIESKEHWKWQQAHDKWKLADLAWSAADAIYNSMQSVNNMADDKIDLSPWDPGPEPQEPSEPQSSSSPSLTHWEVKLSWSQYWQNKWSPKQTTSEFVTSPHVTKTLDKLVGDYFFGTLDGHKASFNAEGRLNDYYVYPGRDRRTIVELYLPEIETHFFRTEMDESDELIIKLYRRYDHGFNIFGDTFFDGTEIQAYDYLGQFRLGGCGEKIRATSGLKKEGDYDALGEPDKTTNSFQTFAYEKDGTGTLTFTKASKSLEVLQKIKLGQSTYDIVYGQQHRQFALDLPFQRFFYQGEKRAYLVGPKLLSPVAQLTNPDQVTPELGLATDDTVIGPPKPLLLAADLPAPSGPVSGSITQALAGKEVTAPIEAASAESSSVLSTTQSYGDAMMNLASAYEGLINSAASGVNPPALTAALTYLEFSNFFHPHVCEFIKRLNRDGVPELLKRGTQQLDNDAHDNGQVTTKFERQFDPGPIVYADYPLENVDFDGGAYSIYNWELFFHVPMLIATQLSTNQQFEDAQTWFHYIFNPTTNSKKSPPQRYWNTLPFFNNSDPENDQIQTLLTALASPATDPTTEAMKKQVRAQIKAWRSDPFNPHLIARMRITAYQKNVVMSYINNLIAWGDQLFSQDTIETINQATLLYILAYDILGPRPETIPPQETASPQSYAQLRPKLDQFSNALVGLENEGVSHLLGPIMYASYPAYSWKGASKVQAPSVNTQSIKSIAGSLYFCIPLNTDILQYWDTIDDRLFKIRNCMNIEGVVRDLPLFEPPINPALLVRAAALGLDLSSVLSDISSPAPYYRFGYMLPKALELASELKSLGGSLLGALEKKDAEGLTALRASQETAILKLSREIKQQQIDEANTTLEGLQKSRDVTNVRYQFYQQIEFMNAEEGAHITLATVAGMLQVGAQALELGASGAYAEPNEFLGGAGWSSPVEITEIGGENFGSGMHAAGQAMNAFATFTNMLASLSATMGGYQRRWDDWKLQEQVAAKELEQIDKQIAAQQIRIAIAEKELAVHDKQIDNAGAIEEFLRNKYTNQELYTWMTSQISTVFFQTYKLAYDVAKRAEKAFRFERGLTTSNYIQFGYWDNLRKGLLSGERLYLDLKRLEMAYLDQNKRDYEIIRHISLLLLNPMALIALKETGRCDVELAEAFFDMDYPGHYMRRIKNVSLTIPCVTGPYTSINCTLTLLSNKVRLSSNAQGNYAENQDGDARFVTNFAAVQSIATSHAQNDNGMFELNFRDDRYLPFEGAGVISRWRIEMPQDCNAFDFETISDVILNLSYTARAGGDVLRNAARKAATLPTPPTQGPAATNVSYPKQTSLQRLFSLRHEFPTDWYKFLHPVDPSVTPQSIALLLTQERFPFQFRGRKIVVSQLDLFLKLNGAQNSVNQLAITVTAPDGTVVSDSFRSDPVLLGGIPHAVIQNLASGISSTQPWSLSADILPFAAMIDDLMVVCSYSAS